MIAASWSNGLLQSVRTPLRSRAGGRVWDSCSLEVSRGDYLDVATNVRVWMRPITKSSCTALSSGMDRLSCPAQDFYFWAMLWVYKSNYPSPGARQGGVLDESSFPVRGWRAAGRGFRSTACLRAS